MIVTRFLMFLVRALAWLQSLLPLPLLLPLTTSLEIVIITTITVTDIAINSLRLAKIQNLRIVTRK